MRNYLGYNDHIFHSYLRILLLTKPYLVLLFTPLLLTYEHNPITSRIFNLQLLFYRIIITISNLDLLTIMTHCRENSLRQKFQQPPRTTRIILPHFTRPIAIADENKFPSTSVLRLIEFGSADAKQKKLAWSRWRWYYFKGAMKI